MLESDARLVERAIQVKGRKYKQLIIYMPRSLATDSAFPFKSQDMLRISILGDRLSIEKAKLPIVEYPVSETLPPALDVLLPVADDVDVNNTQKKDTRKRSARDFFER